MKFTDLFVRRPVLAIVVNLVILIAGLQAIRSLSVRQFPRSDMANVVVSTAYIGANADLVRGFITAPLERAIAGADGIDFLESSSSQGVSTITVHLKLNYDTNAALTQIQSKVAQVRNQLPPEAEAPIIDLQTTDSQFAAAYLGFSSKDLDQNQITDYLTRVVQPKLSAISGVQRASIFGDRTFAMRVWLKPEKMAALGIAPSKVRDALAANNYLSALGSTKGSMTSVNLVANTNLQTPEEFKQLVLREENGTVVRLGDIADVVLGAETYEQEVNFNGQTAVFIGIFTLPTANTLDVMKRVREALPEIQAQLPAGMTAGVPYDSSVYIQSAIDEVLKTLAETLVIVIIVIFLFLGSIRGVIIPVVAIPVSLVGAVIISGIVALTLSPMMGSKLLRAGDTERGFAGFINHQFDKLRAAYTRVLDGTLHYRPVMITLWLIVMLLIVPFYMFSQKELAPTEDQGFIFGIIQAPANSTIDQTKLFASQVQRVYESIPEHRATFQIVFPTGGFGGMIVAPYDQRKRGIQPIQMEASMKSGAIPGLRVIQHVPPSLPGNQGFPVDLAILSTAEPAQLAEFANQLVQKAFTSGKFMFADTDLKFDQPQAKVVFDRDKLRSQGVDMAQAGRDLSTLLSGAFVNRFSIQGRSYKVIPQLKRSERLTPDQLTQIYISGPNGKLVPLSTFATLQTSTEPRDLKRFQQLNAVRIQGAIPPGVSLDTALKYLEDEAHKILPRGYTLDYAGESRQLRTEGTKFFGVFLLSAILIYLVLAAQFESFRDPFIILAGSVPLALAGSLLFSFLGLTSINIYSQVGLITLVGLISRNGILIVQFANHLQEEGRDKLHAVIEAAGTRLRPIMMTTAATVMGHLPLVFAKGPGARSRIPSLAPTARPAKDTLTKSCSACAATNDHRRRHEHPRRYLSRGREVRPASAEALRRALADGAIVACEVVWTEAATVFERES